ncbi:MAG: alkaline phosphatase family protein [Candidatus Binatia bacterium]
MACTNANPDPNGNVVTAFHQTNYCPGPDFDHTWVGGHKMLNFSNPDDTLTSPPMDGFIRYNALTELPNQANGPPWDTMGFYNEVDLPFYYFLAENFAIDDRYFGGVLAQTFPNHGYALAATSFGHLTTAEIGELFVHPPGPYMPINGSIFDLLNGNNITWTSYHADIEDYSLLFAPISSHQQPVSQFATDAAAGTLPAVAFVWACGFPDCNINGTTFETDEHPPSNIQAGEYFVYQNLTALRNGPNWNDSIVFILHDEWGGLYDHVPPPAAAQNSNPTPDGIFPGQCADLSNPPASKQPGGGLDCMVSSTSSTEGAPGICPAFTPTGTYPSNCPAFDQLGFRVPFIAISPFAKKKYVSHTVGDHTSLLALIEKRFLPSGSHLTERDAAANDLEDMFDFTKSPSLKTKFKVAAPAPVQPDTVHNCPFVQTSDQAAQPDDDD